MVSRLVEMSEKGFTITMNCGMIVVTRLFHCKDSGFIYIGKSEEEAVRQCELKLEQEKHDKQMGH